MFISIPNFFNVISNLLFIIVGIIGLAALFDNKERIKFFSSEVIWPYVGLFLGTILTGIGSAYYHWAPNNASLLWDRLPMGIIFMSFFSAFIIERVNRWVGVYLLLPAILIAMLCTIHWEISEQLGQGDLRLYSWSQGYPILMIALIFILFESFYKGEIYLISVFVLFGLAKLTEILDKQIYTWSGDLISGHTLKHVLAAGAIFLIMQYLKYRKISFTGSIYPKPSVRQIKD
ncbi:ceramidase domain-containing protein [Legionella gresilensis]|uniref:ceramidase domain-containing protein n=1 Tax=Legionella gresilensis TaxID=91823 RepID=UPI00104114D8|nr:ceramidase domain-containing protein [Legionella gresilensis]